MSSFEERRAARASWPIQRFKLGEEPVIDTRDDSTVTERIALVWKLTRAQWEFAGLPIPTYPRSEMPGRIIRPPQRRNDDE